MRERSSLEDPTKTLGFISQFLALKSLGDQITNHILRLLILA
jgi:hypothetical protein